MIDETARTAYVGNLRIYRTNDTGKVWQQVFTPESAPYNFPSGGTQIRAIRSCSFDTAIVFAAVSIQGSDLGGVFYSMNSGKNWSQLKVVTATTGQDVDAEDIEFTKSGTTITAWIAVKKNDAGASAYTHGVYKTSYNGVSWSAPTSEASTTTNSVNDLTLSVTKDTLLACGANTSATGPILHMLKVSTGTWKSIARNGGIPVPPDYDAVAMGGDTVFVGSEQYIDYTKSSAGVLQVASIYYAYPNGAQIQNLYYDELLAGTGTGFSSLRIPAILPLHLTRFSGMVTNNGNTLTWRNENDNEVSVYEIEFSCDGRNFTGAAVIASAHTKEYSYTDRSKCTGSIYYRLKIVNNMGNTEYSRIIRLGAANMPEFSVYSNPVVGGTFQLQTSEANATVIVYDISGKEHMRWQQTTAGIASYNVSGLTAGIYIIKVISNDVSKSKTMIIQ